MAHETHDLDMAHETHDLDKAIATARHLYRLLMLLAKDRKSAGNSESSETMSEIMSILGENGYPLFITHSRYMKDSPVERLDFHTKINVLFERGEYDAIILTIEDMFKHLT
jgi:hypothetical protein